MKRNSNFTCIFLVIKTYLQIIYVIFSLTKRRLRYTCWFCFETQESLYGIFISPLKFTQPFEIYVRFSHSHGKPLLLFPVVRNQLLPHPPRVALHELVSFQNSFRKKSSLVVLPRDGFRLRCAIGSRRPATCWLEGKSHLFKFSSRRSLCVEAWSLGAPGAWLTSCVTSIMHVLRHRWTLGVSPLPE